MAFALNPGLVHTAMTEYLMTSEEGKKYFPFYRLMGAGHWLPPERAGEVCVWLASGKADALSGRFIDVYDDLDAVLAQAEDIVAQDRYTMQLRR
jgi:NAD(P)-dependent dehydrogenase (short-subunit alcohol dehydrogenase family)